MSALVEAPLHAHGDMAFGGELEGIAEQVHQYLAQPRRVAIEAARHAPVQAEMQAQAFFHGLGAEQRQGVGEQFLQVEVDALQVQLAGLDASVVEDIVDHRHQRAAGAGDGLHVGRLAAVQRGVAEQLQHAQHAVHRGANLVAHLRQEAALRLVLHPRLLGRLARAEAFLLERIDAVGEADGQGHQFHGHADLDHAAAEQAEQFEAQRGGGGDQERQQQRAPGQDVVEAVAQALAPDVDAGQQQAEGDQHHRQAGEDVPGAQPHQRLAGQQDHAGQQQAAEEAVEAREVAAGVEVAAAELDRHQAAQVHQQVDAGRLQRHVSGQQLEQQAVEAGGKQAEAEVVQQVPGIGGLA
ncbi:Uncharacterised protein [Klebsiella pneumoniae]|nr:Uncharacterised protein [Klebsiella pneumoniae]